MIQLNLRYRWADIFWFSFFHEIRHVLQRNLKYVYVDGRESKDDADEIDADNFAADILIPPRKWALFASSNLTSKSDVLDFAKSVGIHPGIVVGRAQRETWNDYSRLNGLRVRYKWDASA